MPLNPIRTKLQNGATLLVKQTTTTPAVAITLTLRAGSMADPPGQSGLTWLLSRVIDRGTATHSAADIAEALDSRGITLSIGVTRHLFSMVCTCLASESWNSSGTICLISGKHWSNHPNYPRVSRQFS